MRGWGITVVVGVLLGVGVSWEAVDAALSRFFAIALPVVGGLALLVWLVREAWSAWEDWQVLGPPDLGPLRRRREKARDEAGQP